MHNHYKSMLPLAACLALLGCNSPQKAGPQIETNTLLESTTSWDGAPYKAYPAGQPKLTLIQLKIPANTQLPWHTHPMPNAAYIVSGELKVQTREDGLTRTLKQGQTLAEVVDTSHRGMTGNSSVELLVFYAGSPGMPLSQPG